MVIGIDLDDTITNSSDIFIKYAKIYNKEKKINYKINCNEFDQNKAFGWSEKDQKEFTKNYLKKVLNEAEPKEDAVKIINNLKLNGYKIIIITARNDKEISNIYYITEKWLIFNNIKFDKLIINCHYKEDICDDNNVNIFIDDNFENCKRVYKKLKIPVLLFNTNYNRIYTNSKIKRVFNWQEIDSIIKKYGGKYEKQY